MKLKTFLPAILMATGSLQAQVGIGTKTPESQLDVKGNIKIGFEENNQGKEGMLRWSKEKTCVKLHNGENWKCLEFKPNYEPENSLVYLKGTTDISYSNGKGWKDNDMSDASEKNILKLTLRKDKSTNPNYL